MKHFARISSSAWFLLQTFSSPRVQSWVVRLNNNHARPSNCRKNTRRPGRLTRARLGKTFLLSFVVVVFFLLPLSCLRHHEIALYKITIREPASIPSRAFGRFHTRQNRNDNNTRTSASSRSIPRHCSRVTILSPCTYPESAVPKTRAGVDKYTVSYTSPANDGVDDDTGEEKRQKNNRTNDVRVVSGGSENDAADRNPGAGANITLVRATIFRSTAV